MRRLVSAAVLLALGACGADGRRATAPNPSPSRVPAPPPPPLPEQALVCAADVRQCADGSFVSRNPAGDCAFDACPRATP